MISVWEEGLEERQHKLLKRDQSCQILIIGANLTGLLTALFCKSQGYEVIVVEEESLEKRALEIDFFDKIENFKSWTYSIWYAWMTAKYQLKCNFKRFSAFYYWLSEKPTAKMPRQPVFHPIKWMREIASFIEIYEEVTIMDMNGKRLDTGQVFINFDHVIDLRKKEGKEKEGWVALSGISLEQGIYLCMDGTADFLMWKDRIIMRESYQFLFPKGQVENHWEVDAAKKERIYESMEKARECVKRIGKK